MKSITAVQRLTDDIVRNCQTVSIFTVCITCKSSSHICDDDLHIGIVCRNIISVVLQYVQTVRKNISNSLHVKQATGKIFSKCMPHVRLIRKYFSDEPQYIRIIRNNLCSVSQLVKAYGKVFSDTSLSLQTVIKVTGKRLYARSAEWLQYVRRTCTCEYHSHNDISWTDRYQQLPSVTFTDDLITDLITI